MNTNVTSQAVPCDRRFAHTANLFGTHFATQLEPCIFTVAAQLSSDYNGGYWEFHELSNGGFFMVPDADAPFAVTCPNGYQGSMCADALGITACLYAYSHLSFVTGGVIAELYARQYHLLREFTMGHAEVSAILAATD